MKITFFETDGRDEDYFKNQLSGFDLLFFKEKISSENTDLTKGSDIISIFVDSKIDQEVISKFDGLKMITTRSTGFDHIDLPACSEKNITVCNIPHYGDNTVAEHTFALILDLSRKIHNSIESVRMEGFSSGGFMGFDLRGKTLGVIGTGRIGSHVIRIAKGFEMRVLAHDIIQDKKLAKNLGFEYASLEELLKNSDIITLHAPYNQGTHHLINSNNINLIKKGAYLINTSRGGIIETGALIKALNEGIIAGAGLDVLEEEDFIKEESQLLSKEFSEKHNLKTVLQNHVLMERQDVIVTPHNAFNSIEALDRILETTVDNIRAFAKGKPINKVN